VAVLAIAVRAFGALFAVAVVVAALALGLAVVAARAILGRRLGAALVLEVDVVARGEGVTPHDLAGGLVGLHRADDAEVMLGVLQVVLAEDPVAGGRRVARQLLVLLEHVLGVAADLDVVGPIGLERAVDVVLGLAAAAATAAATAVATPVAATLPLH